MPSENSFREKKKLLIRGLWLCASFQKKTKNWLKFTVAIQVDKINHQITAFSLHYLL